MSGALTFHDYLLRPTTDRLWLWEPLIPAGGLINLFGEPKKARKSYFALQLAFAIVQGEPMLGMPTTQSRVLYVQTDTPPNIWQARCQRLEESGVYLSAEAGARLAIVDRESIPYPFDILRQDCYEWLSGQVRSHQADLTIIDTLRKSHAGDEDNSSVMSHVLDRLQGACQPSAVLMISHGRKPKPDGDAGVLHEGRGSSAVSGACDTIMRIRPQTKNHPVLLDWEGRACESAELCLENLPNYFYTLGKEDTFQASLRDTLSRTFGNETKAAEHLSALSGRPTQACKMAIRRALGKA